MVSLPPGDKAVTPLHALVQGAGGHPSEECSGPGPRMNSFLSLAVAPSWLWGPEGSYLLVPGSPDVSGVGVCPCARHSTEPATRPPLHPARAATGLGARLLGRRFLLVLLPLQVLTVGLQAERETCVCVCVCTYAPAQFTHGDTQTAPCLPSPAAQTLECPFVKPSHRARRSAWTTGFFFI